MPSPSDSLRVEVTSRPGMDVIRLSGELDLYTSIVLRNVVYDPASWGAPVVVVDLNGLDFMDSSGLAALVAARRWVQYRGSELVLACAGGQPVKVLKAVRLDFVFRIVPRPEDALPPSESCRLDPPDPRR